MRTDNWRFPVALVVVLGLCAIDRAVVDLLDGWQELLALLVITPINLFTLLWVFAFVAVKEKG